MGHSDVFCILCTLGASLVANDRQPSANNYLPAFNKFTYKRTAPGTPAGSCRKNA